MASDRVLLVDDRRTNLVALEALLAPLDCELILAETGEEALQRLLTDDVAVILLDVQLPGMDGFEVAELIKQRERTRHIPLLFITATAEAKTAMRGYAAGAVDYVAKPFDPALLRAKVGAFIELSRTHRRIRQQADDLAAELSRREERTQRLAEEVSELRRSNARLERMIDGLMSSAPAVVDAATDDVAMADVVEEVRAALRETIAERDALVDVGPMPVVRYNRAQLVVVLHNLISNAVKFVPPGRRPTVQVAAERRGERWMVSVADNGIGVSDEERGSVFELSATRLSDDVPPRMGLAVCARIVRSNGGTLDVAPGRDGGSVFSFDLPDASRIDDGSAAGRQRRS